MQRNIQHNIAHRCIIMGDQAQHTRQRIMDQIQDTIHKFLQEIDSKSTRILGKTPNCLLDPEIIQDLYVYLF